MADSTFKAIEATIQLKGDHKRLRELFSNFQRIGTKTGGAKSELFETIRTELTHHAALEEEIFYPAVHQATGTSIEVASATKEDHTILKLLLADLSALEPDGTAFDAKMPLFIMSFLHHAAEEEKHLFPLFGTLSSEMQECVSERLQERRLELTL